MRESDKTIASGCRQHVKVIQKTELGVRKSNALESALSEIVQSQTMTCFLHDKNNQSDHNYNVLHGKKEPIKKVFGASHPCSYGLIAWRLASQIPVILHNM